MSVSVFDMVSTQHSWSTEELRNIYSEQSRYKKYLDFEAALAQIQAELGLIPSEAAQEIVLKCKLEHIDIDQIASEIRRIKHPLVPFLRQVQSKCEGGAGEWLHYGVTTQDVIDTAAVLQLKDAHEVFMRDLKELGRELSRLAATHSDTPMVGRTHGVHALPITFGHKCAIWLDEMRRHYERFEACGRRALTGMVAGAVGSQASMGALGKQVEDKVLSRLGLASPDISWAPSRDRFAEYAANIAMLGSTISKIGNELFNMQRNEISEVEEMFSEGKVGSSTMPHKRNPIISENLAGLSRTLRANAMLMMEAMVQEGERDGVAWKVEWKAFPECCLILGVMLQQAIVLLSTLKVNKTVMMENMNRLQGYLLSERVMLELGSRVGKQTAHEWVYEASMSGLERGVDFEKAILDHEELRNVLTLQEVGQLTDPRTYLGLCCEAVDRVIESQKELGWLS